jgi:hypothetical protein
MDDRAIVARQLGRPPRAFRRVVVRCPFGLPAVTEQDPFDANGEPFPTTYYVTCRHLVASISRLEAVGGVERWSQVAESDPDLAASLAQATEEQQKVRHELVRDSGHAHTSESLDLGIGGSRSVGHLKCLHAHAAFALARPGYALGEAIMAEVDPLWPQYRCCSKDLPKPS